MRDYELTYIVHPQLDREGLAATVEEVKGLVESTGGVVHKVDLWGLRRLAYPLQKVREGQYVFMQVSLKADGVAELERGLRLKEQIIRHLIVRLGEEE